MVFGQLDIVAYADEFLVQKEIPIGEADVDRVADWIGEEDDEEEQGRYDEQKAGEAPLLF